MKRLIFTCLSFFLCQFLAAQDTCFIETKNDQFDNIKEFSLTQIILQESDYFFLFANKKNDNVTVLFTLERKGLVTCFKNGGDAIFLFEDGSKATFKNEDDLNCKGYFLILTKALNESGKSVSVDVNKLLTKNIKAIRFYGTDGYFDIEINEDNSADRIRQGLSCLFKIN